MRGSISRWSDRKKWVMGIWAAILVGLLVPALQHGFHRRSKITSQRNAATLPDVMMRVNSVDDLIRLNLNGQRVHEGGPTDWVAISPRLHKGSNQLDIEVFNNPTRTGGLRPLKANQREGWGYSMTLRVGESEFQYNGGHGNEPPENQWGQWFAVRSVGLNVDPESGTITTK